MNNITPYEEYCQELEKSCLTGGMPWERAFNLLKGYFIQTNRLLDKTLDTFSGIHTKTVDTNTEFGEVIL